MIWLAVISTLTFNGPLDRDGYQTTFVEARTAASCAKVVRTAMVLRPGYVVGRCIRIKK